MDPKRTHIHSLSTFEWNIGEIDFSTEYDPEEQERRERDLARLQEAHELEQQHKQPPSQPQSQPQSQSQPQPQPQTQTQKQQQQQQPQGQCDLDDFLLKHIELPETDPPTTPETSTQDVVVSNAETPPNTYANTTSLSVEEKATQEENNEVLPKSEPTPAVDNNDKEAAPSDKNIEKSPAQNGNEAHELIVQLFPSRKAFDNTAHGNEVFSFWKMIDDKERESMQQENAPIKKLTIKPKAKTLPQTSNASTVSTTTSLTQIFTEPSVETPTPQSFDHPIKFEIDGHQVSQPRFAFAPSFGEYQANTPPVLSRVKEMTPYGCKNN